MQSYLAQASTGKNRHGLWFVFVVLCVFLAYVIGQVPLIFTIQSKVSSGAITSEDALVFYDTADFDAVGISSTVGLVLLLLSFVAALIVLLVLVRYLHNRSMLSLVSPARKVHWRKFFFAMIVWFLLTAIVEVVLYVMDPQAYNFVLDWRAWLPLIVVALLMLPLQTTFEELLVRGYLMQRIAVAFNRPWPAVVLTAAFFGVMHLGNPEIEEFGLVPMMGYYVSVGLALAVITVLDNGLEYALGIHAATNIYGAGFVTYTGSALQTDALVRVEVVSPGLMILFFIAAMVIFALLAQKVFGMGRWNLLWSPVRTVGENNHVPSDIDTSQQQDQT